MRDPLGHDTTIAYDHPYHLLPVQVTERRRAHNLRGDTTTGSCNPAWSRTPTATAVR